MPYKVSPNKKQEKRYLSPLPRDPALDMKASSPKLGTRRIPNEHSPKLPQKPIKHVTDTALEPPFDGKRLHLPNPSHVSSSSTSSGGDLVLSDNDFPPLPPLQAEPSTTRKNNDILDHKKHIEEIEAKMSKCMQISVGSSTLTTTTSRRDSLQSGATKYLTTQSSDEAVFQVLMAEEQMDLERMKNQLKESTAKHEYFLDKMCDEMTKESPQKKVLGEQGNIAVKKKKSFDSAKKTKLLAALKAIDGNDSVDKS